MNLSKWSPTSHHRYSMSAPLVRRPYLHERHWQRVQVKVVAEDLPVCGSSGQLQRITKVKESMIVNMRRIKPGYTANTGNGHWQHIGIVPVFDMRNASNKTACPNYSGFHRLSFGISSQKPEPSPCAKATRRILLGQKRETLLHGNKRQDSLRSQAVQVQASGSPAPRGKQSARIVRKACDDVMP